MELEMFPYLCTAVSAHKTSYCSLFSLQACFLVRVSPRVSTITPSVVTLTEKVIENPACKLSVVSWEKSNSQII